VIPSKEMAIPSLKLTTWDGNYWIK
jgi:hypothetical protein